MLLMALHLLLLLMMSASAMDVCGTRMVYMAAFPLPLQAPPIVIPDSCHVRVEGATILQRGATFSMHVRTQHLHTDLVTKLIAVSIVLALKIAMH